MIDSDFVARMADKCLLTDADLDAALRDTTPKRIQTVNLHHLALAARDEAFAQTIESADYITADGWPIVSLMRAQGVEPERVTGSELIERMVNEGEFAGLRVGILGADEAPADEFHTMLDEQGVVVVFREHGNKADWDPAEIAEILEDLAVDLLLVAVTPPFGDAIAESVRAAGFRGTTLNIGGSIQMIAGSTTMAPDWARRSKVEWLYRFVQEPKRLFRRYFVECLPVFARHVLPTYWRQPAPALASLVGTPVPATSPALAPAQPAAAAASQAA